MKPFLLLRTKRKTSCSPFKASRAPPTTRTVAWPLGMLKIRNYALFGDQSFSLLKKLLNYELFLAWPKLLIILIQDCILFVLSWQIIYLYYLLHQVDIVSKFLLTKFNLSKCSIPSFVAAQAPVERKKSRYPGNQNIPCKVKSRGVRPKKIKNFT